LIMETVTLAKHGDLFCIPCGKGFTCLGFDVCRDRTLRLSDWLRRPDLAPVAPRGTLASYAEYRAVHVAAEAHCTATRSRCPVELTPALEGLEGWRVEVLTPDGERRRFIVGRSTGWLPCHLEISRRNALGGMAAMGPYLSVRKLEKIR
jgi:hypothetical protein